MNTEEIKELAEQIIVSGFEADQDADQIKMAMMKEGVPFSKLNSLYQTITIDLGLIVDPKQVTSELKEKIEATKWGKLETFSEVEEVVDALVDAVDGATSKRALTLIRIHCRENEIELPRKPRGTSGGAGRIGKLSVALVDLVVNKKKPTKEDAVNAILDMVGGQDKYKTALGYVNSTFAVALAAKRGEPLATIIAELNEQPDPQGESVDEEETMS